MPDYHDLGRNYPNTILCIGRLVILFLAATMKCEACGSYKRISAGGTGYIQSPVNYGSYINCIWWLETDRGYQLSINVTYEPDVNYGRCGDFVIMKDGKTESDVIYDESQTCTARTNHVVTATASWLQVQFRSDGINYTSGFQGHIYSTFVGSNISELSNPIEDCRSYEWGCENKVCMTMSYRCDGFNDCGCTTGCDEHLCDGLAIDKYTIMIIGGCVGCGLFIAFFMFAFAYERHLKQRALMADPEAQADLQRKKDQKKRKEAYRKAMKENRGRR